MDGYEKIIGYTAEKKVLEQISDVLNNPEPYARLGVDTPKGLLLYGEPGVGKTLMANALTKSSGMKAFVCRKNEPNGEFVKVIKRTFEDAAAHAPSIVFLDDMDKFANEDSAHCNAEEYVTIQACIDEYRGKGIFVLATANDIEDLPDSLLRAGRFDRVMEITPPKGKNAESIVRYYLSGKKIADDIDVELIARMLDGRSCAELETIVNDAGIYAGFERKDAITMQHLLRASLSRIYEVPSELFEEYKPVDLSAGYSNATANVYHEAGHVVIAEVLYRGCTTLASTFHKKGEESGFTMTTNHLMLDNRTWRKISLVIGHGGRAAVERIFGFTDGGDKNDISEIQSTILDELGNSCVYGLDLYSQGVYANSDSLKQRLEQSNAVLSKHYYRKAKEILALNHRLLERVAEALAFYGMLDMNGIRKLVEECGIVDVALG